MVITLIRNTYYNFCVFIIHVISFKSNTFHRGRNIIRRILAFRPYILREEAIFSLMVFPIVFFGCFNPHIQFFRKVITLESSFPKTFTIREYICVNFFNPFLDRRFL